MLVVGLTGGIGSGKSTVTRLFAERGAAIIDADVIARELTEPNQPAYLEIINHFGHTIILPNGALNRAALRNIIFNQPDERYWLEALLHPLIINEINNQLAHIKATYCIVVIPLLSDASRHPFLNRILVIDTPIAEQINRVTQRDAISPQQAEAILATQLNREQRLLLADDLIINDKSIDSLIPQVEKLHAIYSQKELHSKLSDDTLK